MWKFGEYWPTPLHNADFQCIFACRASAITPSKKVQLTWIGSPLCTFQWAWDEQYTLTLSPQKGAVKRSVQNLNNTLRYTSKRREVGSQLLLVTDRKSHTVFRLVPTSVTLNDIIALILLYFTEFDSFAGLLCHRDWRQTYIVCRISSSTFGQNWTTLQRGFSAIAELLVTLMLTRFILGKTFDMFICSKIDIVLICVVQTRL